MNFNALHTVHNGDIVKSHKNVVNRSRMLSANEERHNANNGQFDDGIDGCLTIYNTSISA